MNISFLNSIYAPSTEPNMVGSQKTKLKNQNKQKVTQENEFGLQVM